MKNKEWQARAKAAFARYKYVLLVLLVGFLLLLWPEGQTPDAAQAPAQSPEDPFETGALEAKLERALSRIDGAGEVTVVLTVETGQRRFLAQDASQRAGEGTTEKETSVVLASQGAGSEEALELQRIAPGYRGALVISSGGEDPRVKLAMTQALSALTGLGTDKISVCKGK